MTQALPTASIGYPAVFEKNSPTRKSRGLVGRYQDDDGVTTSYLEDQNEYEAHLAVPPLFWGYSGTDEFAWPKQ
jgi:hypothetical protein